MDIEKRQKEIVETWNENIIEPCLGIGFGDFLEEIIEQEKLMLAESEKAKAELLEAIEDCLRYSKMKEECVICVGACSRNCYINEKRKLIQKHQETN